MPLLSNAKTCIVYSSGENDIQKIYAGTDLVWSKIIDSNKGFSLHYLTSSDSFNSRRMGYIYAKLVVGNNLPSDCDSVPDGLRLEWKERGSSVWENMKFNDCFMRAVTSKNSSGLNKEDALTMVASENQFFDQRTYRFAYGDKPSSTVYSNEIVVNGQDSFNRPDYQNLEELFSNYIASYCPEDYNSPNGIKQRAEYVYPSTFYQYASSGIVTGANFYAYGSNSCDNIRKYTETRTLYENGADSGWIKLLHFEYTKNAPPSPTGYSEVWFKPNTSLGRPSQIHIRQQINGPQSPISTHIGGVMYDINAPISSGGSTPCY